MNCSITRKPGKYYWFFSCIIFNKVIPIEPRILLNSIFTENTFIVERAHAISVQFHVTLMAAYFFHLNVWWHKYLYILYKCDFVVFFVFKWCSVCSQYWTKCKSVYFHAFSFSGLWTLEFLFSFGKSFCELWLFWTRINPFDFFDVSFFCFSCFFYIFLNCLYLNTRRFWWFLVYLSRL